MNKFIHITLTWIIGFYIFSTAILGMMVTAYFSVGYYYKTFVPKDLPVELENGFIYADGPNPSIGEKVFYTQNGDVAIKGNVRDFLIYKESIYGNRYINTHDGMEYRYFICSYGEDCASSQDYSEKELEEIIKTKALPMLGFPGIRSQPLLQTKEWIKIRFFGKKPFSAPFLKWNEKEESR
jgi:hypothetical protein